MSVIFRRPWTRQPQFPVAINRGIVGAGSLLWMPHTGEIASNAQPTFSGLVRSPGPLGQSALIATTGDRVDYAPPTSLAVSSVTLFAVLSFTSAASGKVAMSLMDGTTRGHYLSVETGSKLSIVSTNDGAYSVCNGPTIALDSLCHVVCVCTSTSRQIFVNGIEYAANTDVRSLGSSTLTLMIGAFNNNGTPALAFNGRIYLAGCVSGNISAAQARKASENVFKAVFAPQTSRIWVPQAATGVPTLTSIAASSITSTGAVLTIN